MLCPGGHTGEQVLPTRVSGPWQLLAFLVWEGDARLKGLLMSLQPRHLQRSPPPSVLGCILTDVSRLMWVALIAAMMQMARGLPPGLSFCGQGLRCHLQNGPLTASEVPTLLSSGTGVSRESQG